MYDKTPANETEELKKRVELTDRNFRRAQAAFMVVVLFSFVVVFGFLINIAAQATDQLKQQAVLLEQQRQSTEELKRDATEKLNQQTEYIKCIAEFFASGDRENRVLADIETSCKVVEKPASASSFTWPAPTGQTTNLQSPQMGVQRQGPNPQTPNGPPEQPPADNQPTVIEATFDQLCQLGLLCRQ